MSCGFATPHGVGTVRLDPHFVRSVVRPRWPRPRGTQTRAAYDTHHVPVLKLAVARGRPWGGKESGGITEWGPDMYVRNVGKVVAAAAIAAVSLSACEMGQESSAPTPALGSVQPPSDPGVVPSRAETAPKPNDDGQTISSSPATPTQEAQTPTSSSPGSTGTDASIDDSTCQRALLEGSFGVDNDENTNYANGFLTVTNTAARACTLHPDGPWVMMLGRQGTALEGVNYTRDFTTQPTAITLQPGQSASSELQWQDEGNCQGRAWAVNVSVHPSDTPMQLDPLMSGQVGQFDVCGGTVQVGAFKKD